MRSVYDMYAVVVLIVCLSSVNGQSHIGASDSEIHDPQWRDLVNQKIGQLERQMTLKDVIINQLESKIQNQNADMMQLKQKMASLEQLVLRKDTAVSNLAKQIADLGKRGSVDKIRALDISPLAGNTSRSLAQVSGNFTTSVNSTSFLDYQNEVLSEPNTNLSGAGNENHSQSPTGPYRVVQTSRQNRVSAVPSTHPIVFHASVSSTVNHGTLTTVVFDREILDQGNGYSPTEGIYIVPQSGTYVITWTILCDLHSAFQTNLIVNGKVRGSSFTDADEINDWHQTSQLVALELSQGDRVFIQVGNVFRGGDAKIKSDNTLSHPTFSGWKIS
ncbi:uncharacterized protein LOC110450773 [Mizuhopecten yessoensis]|uniref:Complement C1q-like protein 4 n=1 Tax=Mizuhopecten yessoensis TaxID=6573 RepID=A0A210QN84_MIZYE|nr:uncharacterized protein LOC110450773 [Mizuhopecten yessoensis]OWF50182.1 Complement C1q-like protein 4 [Mizuhopecten yessoensis]